MIINPYYQPPFQSEQVLFKHLFWCFCFWHGHNLPIPLIAFFMTISLYLPVTIEATSVVPFLHLFASHFSCLLCFSLCIFIVVYIVITVKFMSFAHH